MRNQRLNPGNGYNIYKINSIPEIRGLTYPLTLDGKGGLKTSSDLDLVKEHIYSVLETLPFERIMRAHYGLNNQVMNAIDSTLIDLQVKRALEEEVVEVESFDVVNLSTPDDLANGIYNLSIYWTFEGQKPQAPLNIRLEK